LDQAHNDILSSQRALYKPQTLKRVKQCPVGPQDTRSENHIIERTSRLKASEPMTKAQSPLRITIPAIKHRSPNYAALQTLNRQGCQTHGQTTVCFEINHDDVKIYSKRLNELP